MKKLLTLILCLMTCLALLSGCGKEDSPEATTTDRNLAIESTGNEEQIDGNYNEEDTELDIDTPDHSDEESEESDEPITNEKTPQENVEDDPSLLYSGSGTFNGFIDGHSIEVTLPDGSYQTFFVYEEDLYEALTSLSEKEEFPLIAFTYTGRDGQVIPEIIALQ